VMDGCILPRNHVGLCAAPLLDSRKRRRSEPAPRAADETEHPVYQAGDRVELEFHNGWYAGEVVCARRTKDGWTYNVDFDDGDKQEAIEEDELRAPRAPSTQARTLEGTGSGREEGLAPPHKRARAVPFSEAEDGAIRQGRAAGQSFVAIAKVCAAGRSSDSVRYRWKRLQEQDGRQGAPTPDPAMRGVGAATSDGGTATSGLHLDPIDQIREKLANKLVPQLPAKLVLEEAEKYWFGTVQEGDRITRARRLLDDGL